MLVLKPEIMSILVERNLSLQILHREDMVILVLLSDNCQVYERFPSEGIIKLTPDTFEDAIFRMLLRHRRLELESASP